VGVGGVKGWRGEGEGVEGLTSRGSEKIEILLTNLHDLKQKRIQNYRLICLFYEQMIER
jgi:hypothetical protein